MKDKILSTKSLQSAFELPRVNVISIQAQVILQIFQERLVHLLALGPLKFLQVKKHFMRHLKVISINKSDIEGSSSCATRHPPGQGQESSEAGQPLTSSSFQ